MHKKNATTQMGVRRVWQICRDRWYVESFALIDCPLQSHGIALKVCGYGTPLGYRCQLAQLHRAFWQKTFPASIDVRGMVPA